MHSLSQVNKIQANMWFGLENSIIQCTLNWRDSQHVVSKLKELTNYLNFNLRDLANVFYQRITTSWSQVQNYTEYANLYIQKLNLNKALKFEKKVKETMVETSQNKH